MCLRKLARPLSRRGAGCGGKFAGVEIERQQIAMAVARASNVVNPIMFFSVARGDAAVYFTDETRVSGRYVPVGFPDTLAAPLKNRLVSRPRLICDHNLGCWSARDRSFVGVNRR